MIELRGMTHHGAFAFHGWKLGVCFLLGLLLALPSTGSAEKRCQFDPFEPGFESEKREAAEVQAIRKWMRSYLARHKKRHPKATFVFLGKADGDLKTFIKQRNTFTGRCLEGYWLVDLELDAPRCAFKVKSGRPYAENCCGHGPCPRRTPAGWMLELFRRSKPVDVKGLLTLISPTAGYRKTISGQPTRVYTRGQGSKAARAMEADWDPSENLDCPARFANSGEATCSVSRSGWNSDYRWKKTGRGTFLLSFTHEDTGE